ncbi:coenzyme F420-0:L-glutamate ligase [Ruegeria sp.]|uniref:coenzyme F420-0:L-glutamate ligase n=1 Tax=Ruegeria sp. TaxID=1879320 RepID=UPI003C7B9ECB
MRITVECLPGLPEIRPGDDLVGLALAAWPGVGCADGDILVLAQKIVSKAEDRIVNLGSVTASAEATRLGEICGKDARLVELILQESQTVMRAVPGVLIVRHRLGMVMANAGIDQSNVGLGPEDVLLLPEDSDKSASTLLDQLQHQTAKNLGVIIADSFGRAWRHGTCGVAIGSAGVTALRSMTGTSDLHGRILQHTEIGTADEIAAMASLAMGQGAEGTPAALVRGAGAFLGQGRAQDLVRPVDQDLFP